MTETNYGESNIYTRFDEKCVNLQTVRDSFFMLNPQKTIENRENLLQEKIDELILELNSLSETISKADFAFFSGKLLNVKLAYNAKSEENLSRAVKLNPSHVDAWNELGDCLWKKHDLLGARNCFESALQKVKNKISLRNLSIILRQLYKNEKNEIGLDIIKQSFDLAKDAVDLDPNDGVSLYILGNAYLTSFFYSAQLKPEYIQKSLEFYQKAAKDPKTVYNSDLYFNQAVAMRYEENYQTALDSYQRSLALDPSFVSAKQQMNHLLSYLPLIYENVTRKGKMKPKRLQELQKSICRQTDLGPFVGGFYKSANGSKCELKYSTIGDLQIGSNPSKVCLGRVVAAIFNENVIPLTFCIVDESGYCSAVTVYNFNEKFGVTIGQSVAIAEPYFAEIEVKIGEKTLKFPSIRAPTPEVLVVNGRKCGKNAYASTDVTVSNI